ncbi:MAG: FKBP-type peptidyl-prolyl cis-trans isomerase [Bacteroides sp.]|nr:FKBP-type peptidyl-prolyl cis-trans isomerase [Bacteroides sp.]
MKSKLLLFPLLCMIVVAMSSCLNNDEPDYNEWEQRNTKYVEDAEAETADGVKVWTKMTPPWAPGAFILAKWENDRSETANALCPLDNSLVHVKYALDNIDGTRISDSYSITTYGEGIYQTRPVNNITGFWYILTQMHIGDKVKCIMPAAAAYGNVAYGTIPPYSTLVYTIELVDIPAFETPL